MFQPMSAAKFVCMCGVVHALPRERVLDGLSVAHWRCTDCGRRFVLTHTPPHGFAPVYLDGGVRSIEPRETGSSASTRESLGNPVPPPALDFSCRCGATITAHSWTYGASLVCPGCGTTILVALRYHRRRKEYLVVPEYPAKV
jgi:DNA-directed RNA polymerase subunit RPC12/RpoP